MHEFLLPLVEQIDQQVKQLDEAADLVDACAPLMSDHVERSASHEMDNFINTLQWPDQDASTYARQRVAQAADDSWSLYAITWNPGQYTPIHDHGTWGVVTVLQGRLYEHQMQRTDDGDDENITMVRAGVCILKPGAVNTFTAYPDHIHYTGVPQHGLATASLHLYGKLMTRYYAYDLTTGTRYPLDVE